MHKKLLEMTFNMAQDAYYLHYNKDHTPKDPRERPVDTSDVLRWGRAWLTVLTLHDNCNGVDPGGPTLEQMVDHAMTADLDDILVAMYG